MACLLGYKRYDNMFNLGFQMDNKRLTIDCVSDLHGNFPQLNGGDLLIIAGDLTVHDRLEEYQKFDDWVRNLNYRMKVVVGGNHDNFLQNGYTIKYANYLFDSGITFGDLKIWGSPWTKRFEGMNPRCMAFTAETDEELETRWKLIPSLTDILITHSPPYGIKDRVFTDSKWNKGSKSLMDKVNQLRIKLHVFGHIHEDYGMARPNLDFIDCPGYPIFVNASHVNEQYKPINKPIRVEL